MKKYRFLFILIALLLIPKFISFANTSDSANISAILYDTSQYGEKTGTTLTEEGAVINNWSYRETKFLQINPNTPDDDDEYSITVILPKEMYVLTNNVVKPVGYSDVTFTKNENINLQNYASSNIYNVKPFSGTFKYTLERGKTGGSIQLEIGYDEYLWDKLGESPVTKENVKPIEVILKNETKNQVVKNVSIKEVYSKEAFALGSVYNQAVYNNYAYTGAVELIKDSVVNYSNTIITSNQVPENLYFEKIQYDITLPSFTYNDKTYYLEVDTSNINVGNYKPIVDESEVSEGKIRLIYNDIYYNTNNKIYNFIVKFPEELKDETLNDYTFNNGKINMYIKDKNSNVKLLKSGAMTTFHYKDKAEENVTFGAINKQTTILDRPSDAISLLGGFVLRNAGLKDSEAKNIKVTIDKNNTNLIHVTTINLPVDVSTPTINVKYTLIDEQGQSYCEQDVCEFIYSFDNPYYNVRKAQNQLKRIYREMLPENHRNYFFKTIEYDLVSLPAETYMFSSGGSNGYGSAGNFFGYVSDEVQSNQSVVSEVILTSENANQLKVNPTTTFSNASSTAYGIDNINVSNNSINAGENTILTGRINVSDYPYGNCTWLQDMVLGLVLPKGVTVNEQSIVLNTLANTFVDVKNITHEDLENGNVLWKIYVDPDVAIGYATESITTLSNGKFLNFSIQLDTAYKMNQQTINFIDSLYAASLTQSNSASGGWAWARKTDIYDVNDNSQTNDAVGGIRAGTATAQFEIVPQKARFLIDDTLELVKDGLAIDLSDKIKMNSKDEILNYKINFDCTNGGSVENFSYFIPIPKTSYNPDEYLIKDVNKFFNTKLNSKAIQTGSDLYSLYYTIDNVNYTNKNDDQIKWYTEEELDEENINLSKITMIKILPKVDIIPNGSRTTITIPLKYDGTEYNEEAGNEIKFSSAGFYLYLINGRESEGNFPTDGVSASINVERELEDINFLLSKDDDNHNVEIQNLPIFINNQSYKINKVEVSGITLRTRDYISFNQNMESIQANTNFAITAQLDDGTEYEILDSANTNPIEIGMIEKNKQSTLTFKIYNSDSIGAIYLETREVVIYLETENGVKFKQKIIINSKPSEASSPEISIQAGKHYTTFDETNNEISISNGSSFTAQYVLNYIPSNYIERQIVFNKNMKVGTTITLIDKVNDEKPTYYYYVVEDDISKIKLQNFTKMGSNEKYQYSNSQQIQNEILLFIVDFNSVENLTNDLYSTYFNLQGKDGVENFNSNSLIFNIYDKRQVNLVNANEIKFNEQLTLQYNSISSLGTETNYTGRKLSIVLKSDNLPLDTYIEANNQIYYLNEDNEFIIPFIDILNNDGILNIKFSSKLLPKNSTNYLINGELWLSKTSNSEQPKAGEKIKEFNFNLINEGVSSPSLKITGIENRIVNSETVGNENKLYYEFECDKSLVTTIELQQKVDNTYQKLTNILSSVNGNTNPVLGVYTIESVNGNNEVRFNLSSSIEKGTYRFVIKVQNELGEIIEVPYNFIINE